MNNKLSEQEQETINRITKLITGSSGFVVVVSSVKNGCKAKTICGCHGHISTQLFQHSVDALGDLYDDLIKDTVKISRLVH